MVAFPPHYPKVSFPKAVLHCRPLPWPVANLQIPPVYNSAFVMLGLWKLHFSLVSWHPAKFRQQKFLEGDYSGLNLVPLSRPLPNVCIEVLMPYISECDYIWR